MRTLFLACCLLLTLAVASPAVAKPITEQPGFDDFVDRMVEEHHFNRERLLALFQGREVRQNIIDAITRPAERLPWYRYRPIFLGDDRINEGVRFWREHHATLARAEEEYGVDPAVIVAIIGVETRYGRHGGAHYVLDALATLGFAYPPRADFFRRELESFLIMTRDEQFDPTELKGSYAGAMGHPQFIASSFRNFAIDFSGDGRRDLWNSWEDVIGSVANYLAEHRWQRGEPIAHKVTGTPDAETVEAFRERGLQPRIPMGELREAGFSVDGADGNNERRAALVRFEQRTGYDYWVGYRNFYAITRYNHSPLYAMAVYQLGRAIEEKYREEDG